MPRRGYAITFLFVLLIACAAAFFGGRWLWSNLRGSLGVSAAWTPPAATATAPTPSREVTLRGVISPSPRPTATRFLIPTVVVATLLPPVTVAPVLPESPTPGTRPPTSTATHAITATPIDNFSFTLAGPARNTIGDCPGNYVLGSVVDRAGKALPGIQLWLQDEFGNQDKKVSKSGADAGKYDFPLSGPPRRFYLAVIDATGKPLSARVEIEHGLGANAGASCHWVDWRQK